jgi:hypothetical protein
MPNDARHLSCILAGDTAQMAGLTATRVDGSGDSYFVAAFSTTQEFLVGLSVAPSRPDWDTENDVNLAGSTRAWSAMTVIMPGTTIPAADQSTLLVIVGAPTEPRGFAHRVFAAAGLSSPDIDLP